MGRTWFEKELDRIKDNYHFKLNTLELELEAGIISEQQFKARKNELEKHRIMRGKNWK